MSARGPEVSPPAPGGHGAAPPAAPSATQSSPPTQSVHDEVLPAAADNDDSDSSPPFEPLFTLLTNATTNNTIHPRVRYIFSDDDASVLLDPSSAAAPDDRPHRPVLVDLAPSADRSTWTVAWAASLGPDFALTASRLQPATRRQQRQHRDDDADDADSSAPGGVLRLEGVEREPVDARPESLPASASGSGVVGREDVDALANEFRRRMGVLRSVISEAEARRKGVSQCRQPDGTEGRPVEQGGNTTQNDETSYGVEGKE